MLQEVRRRLPHESTIYLGDNARAPYGPRRDDEVIRFSGECLDHLVRQDVKAIVVACNTSSSVALAWLRRRCDLPILGVVRPGAIAAAAATRNGRIGVIATEATIRSGAYPRAIAEERPEADVRAHATPALVPLVEAGHLEGGHVAAVVTDALGPLLDPGVPPIDTLLLGCTHYPLLGAVITALVGPGIAVIDSAHATAAALAVVLEVDGIGAPADQVPAHSLFTTGDVEAFRRTTALLFGDPAPAVGSVRLPAEQAVRVAVAPGGAGA